jgi:ATP-dependent helicase YprA (DUF1998 family)
MDVNFRFDLRQANARRLCQLGDPVQAVQSLVATPIRGARGESSQFTPEEINTTESRIQLEDRYMTVLENENGNEPIIVESVSIRKIEIGDAEYQTRLKDLAAKLEEERQRGLTLDEQLANQEKAQQLVAAQKEFERTQAELDAQNQAANIRVILGEFADTDWRTVGILLNYLEINPMVNIDGSPTTPQNVIPAESPQ